MQEINWGLLTSRAIMIFYNCVEELLRCFSAVLSQHIQPVIWIFSTALCCSFISTLGCLSNLLTSFTILLLSPLNCSGGKQMSVKNVFFSTSFIHDLQWRMDETRFRCQQHFRLCTITNVHVNLPSRTHLDPHSSFFGCFLKSTCRK